VLEATVNSQPKREIETWKESSSMRRIKLVPSWLDCRLLRGLSQERTEALGTKVVPRDLNQDVPTERKIMVASSRGLDCRNFARVLHHCARNETSPLESTRLHNHKVTRP
jgi:hypothetical protein